MPSLTKTSLCRHLGKRQQSRRQCKPKNALGTWVVVPPAKTCQNPNSAKKNAKMMMCAGCPGSCKLDVKVIKAVERRLYCDQASPVVHGLFCAHRLVLRTEVKSMMLFCGADRPVYVAGSGWDLLSFPNTSNSTRPSTTESRDRHVGQMLSSDDNHHSRPRQSQLSSRNSMSTTHHARSNRPKPTTPHLKWPGNINTS